MVKLYEYSACMLFNLGASQSLGITLPLSKVVMYFKVAMRCLHIYVLEGDLVVFNYLGFNIIMGDGLAIPTLYVH